jgi:hypothetical protein
VLHHGRLDERQGQVPLHQPGARTERCNCRSSRAA